MMIFCIQPDILECDFITKNKTHFVAGVEMLGYRKKEFIHKHLLLAKFINSLFEKLLHKNIFLLLSIADLY